MTPYYDHDGIEIYHGDCREVLNDLYPMGTGWGAGECVIVDPPWDDTDLTRFAAETIGEFESLLTFTDGRRFRDPVTLFGPPDWVFTWDTMNTWSVGASQPVQQTKHALWYGHQYTRDAELWGDAPPERNHPTTTQVPLEGRRLTDLWRESLRWLHNPTAGSSGLGNGRFGGERDGHPALRHAKPVGWLRCLIGNTSAGPIIDPFMGSGSALRAAKDLRRLAIGIDTDERCCEFAVNSLAQEVLTL